MPDAFTLGPFLIPTFKAATIGSLLLAIWFARRIAFYTGLDRSWTARVAESSIWLGLIGARLGYVAANWSAYQAEPWTALYVWQPGYMPGAGILAGAVYALWRIAQRQADERRAYANALGGGFGAAALLLGGIIAAMTVLRSPGLLQDGAEMPNLHVQNLYGDPVELSSLRGKAVVLNFWVSWCPPCRREMPLLDSISKEYAALGVSVVGLDLSEPPEVVRAYVDSIGVSYPIWVDRPAADNGISPNQAQLARLNVVGLPTTFFIDADGVIRNRYLGELSRALVQNGIDELLERE